MADALLTAAAHHDRLMQEIDHEVNTYGVASLAGLISSVLDARCGDDTEDFTPKAAHYRSARDLFAQLSQQLARLTRPFDLPDTFGDGQ